MMAPTKLTLSGTLDGRLCNLTGEVERTPQPRRSLLSVLNQPFVLWLFSGLALTLLTFYLESNREYQRDQISFSRATAQRKVDDVKLVREMLPQLVRLDAEGNASRAMLAYLATRAGTDPELSRIVVASLQRPQGTTAQEVAAQTEANAAALGERASVAADLPAAPASAAPKRSLLPNAELPKRVYLHIAEDAQRASATALQDALRGQGIGVPAIENVGDRAPRQSDSVRYFHAADRGKAEAVAATVREILGVQPSVRLISGFDTPATRNLIEVWLRQP